MAGDAQDWKPTITRVIRETIEQWIDQKRVLTARDIGDGHCVDFAEECHRKLSVAGMPTGEFRGYFDRDSTSLQTVETSDFAPPEGNPFDADLTPGLPLDWSRFKEDGCVLPKGIGGRKALSAFLWETHHCWLWHDGHHFDATAPEGKKSFMEMPFFADQIDAIICVRHTFRHLRLG